MNNKRLLAIANYIEKNDCVVDIGCDHGYLSIYLKKNNLCKMIVAADISQNALNSAKKNINKEGLDIKTVVSDGLENIDDKVDTIVIAGMGGSTIKHILNNGNLKSIKKIIIQSNNDLRLVRYLLNDLGFGLVDNTIVKERNKFYEIMLFNRETKNVKEELEFGIMKKEYKEYYNFLVSKYQEIINNAPNKRNDLLIDIEYLSNWT